MVHNVDAINNINNTSQVHWNGSDEKREGQGNSRLRHSTGSAEQKGTEQKCKVSGLRVQACMARDWTWLWSTKLLGCGLQNFWAQQWVLGFEG